jgi:hypothetical protein
MPDRDNRVRPPLVQIFWITQFWDFAPSHYGTCVPNLRGRGWVEHTQMHLVEKKGTKNFHYTSNSLGISSEFTFSWNKNLNGGYEGPGVL